MLDRKKNGRNRQTIFIHIGYPKTGSTFLQQRLFRFHPEIHSLNEIEDFQNLFTAVVAATDSNRTIEDVKRQGILNHISEDKINVISLEGITDVRTIRAKNGLDKPLSTVISDLVRLFSERGEVHFLVVFRDQTEAILSRYAEQYSAFMDFDPEFKDASRFCLCLFKDSEAAKQIRDLYDYENTYKILKNTGCDFRIIFFESLVANRRSVLRRLSRYLGVNALFTNFLTRREMSRVSPKKSRYEYLRSYNSDNSSKLDDTSHLGRDPVLSYVGSLSDKPLSNPARRFLYYAMILRLLVIRPYKYVYKTVREVELEKANLDVIRLDENEVQRIKAYYEDSNCRVASMAHADNKLL